MSLDQVSTVAGELFLAEVTNKNEADDDSKPFLEFMVSNKRGRFLKPKTGDCCSSRPHSDACNHVAL